TLAPAPRSGQVAASVWRPIASSNAAVSQTVSTFTATSRIDNQVTLSSDQRGKIRTPQPREVPIWHASPAEACDSQKNGEWKGADSIQLTGATAGPDNAVLPDGAKARETLLRPSSDRQPERPTWVRIPASGDTPMAQADPRPDSAKPPIPPSSYLP